MKNLNRAVIRLGHPLAFSGFLQHIGAPVAGYFRRQGLPALCNDPNALIPLHKAWQFFGDTSSREDRMLGWHVGKYVGDHNLSAGLIEKLEGSPTLYRALKAFTRLVKCEASHLQLGISEYPSGIRFFTRYPGMKDEDGYDASQSYQLGIFIDLVRHYAGRDWSPEEIGVEAATVSTVVRELYPCSRIRVKQPFGYITIPHSCLPLELRRGHELSDSDNRLIDPSGLSDAQILSLLLEPYLSQGYPTMRFAASLMGISKRTLARRLAACGKGYQVLIDELRFRKASELLLHTDEPTCEIAGAIGFNDQANFYRMFRRVGGLGPCHFRRAARSGMGRLYSD
jgi:AraC-like DNA-binding protein